MFPGYICLATETGKIENEDYKLVIKKNVPNTLLINTLSLYEQECLIPNTIKATMEEKMINDNIKNSDINIILYGKNSSDQHIEKKYLKLIELGFNNIFIYPGGLFEWLILQDIYGIDSFPTTNKELDILKFKPKSQFMI